MFSSLNSARVLFLSISTYDARTLTGQHEYVTIWIPDKLIFKKLGHGYGMHTTTEFYKIIVKIINYSF